MDLAIETTRGLKFARGQDRPVANVPSLWDKVLRSEFRIRLEVGCPVSWRDDDFQSLPEASRLGGDSLCTRMTSAPVGEHLSILAMVQSGFLICGPVPQIPDYMYWPFYILYSL